MITSTLDGRTLMARVTDEPGDPWWREPLCDWLRKHGIDPTLVPLSCVIECDDANRTVAVTQHVLADDGRSVVMNTEHPEEPLIVMPRVQLEAPPLPWPTEVLEAIA